MGLDNAEASPDIQFTEATTVIHKVQANSRPTMATTSSHEAGGASDVRTMS